MIDRRELTLIIAAILLDLASPVDCLCHLTYLLCVGPWHPLFPRKISKFIAKKAQCDPVRTDIAIVCVK